MGLSCYQMCEATLLYVFTASWLLNHLFSDNTGYKIGGREGKRSKWKYCCDCFLTYVLIIILNHKSQSNSYYRSMYFLKQELYVKQLSYNSFFLWNCITFFISPLDDYKMEVEGEGFCRQNILCIRLKISYLAHLKIVKI